MENIQLRSEVLDNGDLKISLFNEEEKDTLLGIRQEAPDFFDSDNTMLEVFDHFISNSEYEWVQPIECSALTSAPILCIFGEVRPLPVWMKDQSEPSEIGGQGNRLAGSWPDEDGQQRIWVEDCIDVWKYEPYALRSPQEDLLRQGYCIFSKG